MAYKRKELRILSGSLNVNQPGDKVPAEDATELENFRVDQDGALRSRAGTSFIWQGGDGASEVHTIGRMGGAYYFGQGTDLYQVGADSPIATGLSGQPFGIAAMNGFAWIIDRNVQGRSDGTTFTTNVPAAPASPTAAYIGADDPNGLSGTYVYYMTFVTSIGETNPGPASVEVSPNGQDVSLDSIPISSDPTVIGRSIYRVGGVLGQAYLVATINDNTTTTFTDNVSDTAVAAEGVTLEFDHDPPPPAAAVVGPYFGRLLAFSTSDHPNRMWWTKPGEPQWWPGATLADGQWVDIGDAGEEILWISVKARHAIIYKERSIWRLIGDPDTGYLEIANSRMGLAGRRAVANAGQLDYFAASTKDGVYSTADGVVLTKVSQKVEPMFLGRYTDLGSGWAFAPPISFANVGRSAMEYIRGHVFLSYPEEGYTGAGNNCTLVYHEASGKWAKLRINNAGGSNVRTGFACLFYAGDRLWGGTGNSVVRIDQGLGAESEGYTDLDQLGPINLTFQSRFEDCGQPDNPKVLLDLVLDYQTGALDGANNVLSLWLLTDNGANLIPLGSISSTTRLKTPVVVPTNPSLEFTNLAVRITCPATQPVTIHAIYLYYYVEARPADQVTTLPFQLGGGRVTQVRELQVDIDSPAWASLSLASDMPGNAIATRKSLQIPTSTGRRPIQLPFGGQTLVEGRMWKVIVTGFAFRLYGVRALARVVGTYIEAYEAAAGFVWDSGELSFQSGITHVPRQYAIALYADPIKRAREIELQIETTGPVTVEFWSDLPGNLQQKRASFTVNTGADQTTIVGRRPVRLPLPAGLNAPVEGRLLRLFISGNSQFKLYEAAVEILPVGVYLEAYEAAGGAVYDSRELDLGTPKVKEAREIELDIDTAGATVKLLTDLPSGVMAVAFSEDISTNGRQKVMFALPIVEGRLLRLLVSGSSSFALYGARIFLRAFGQYLTGGEGTSGAFWDSTELDLGTPQVKQLREVELDIWAYGQTTVTVSTELPGAAMAVRANVTIAATNGRTKVHIPLQQGAVPENYTFGRLLRVTVASQQSVKLFGARVDIRPIGLYIESAEAAAGAVWDSTPLDLGNPHVKAWDEVRFEMDSDGPVNAAAWTELPGEVMIEQYSGRLAQAAMARGWATVPLPAGIEGRSARIILSSPSGFRLYKAQVRARIVGRYIAAQNGANPPDNFRTLDYDYGLERVKLFKKIEADVETDDSGVLNFTVWTNQNGHMAEVFQQQIQTSGERETLKIYLPPNIRGRLMRIEMTSTIGARIYQLRVWTRPINEPNAAWNWAPYPLEESTPLPEWSDLPLPETPPMFKTAELPVEPTPPQWQWADFPVMPTDATWNWARVLSVDETSDKWEWVEIPGTRDPAVEEG